MNSEERYSVWQFPKKKIKTLLVKDIIDDLLRKHFKFIVPPRKSFSTKEYGKQFLLSPGPKEPSIWKSFFTNREL